MCSKLVWLQTSVLVYVLVLCDILLALRVWALYERSRKILIASVLPELDTPEPYRSHCKHPRLCILLFIETGALISTAAQISGS